MRALGTGLRLGLVALVSALIAQGAAAEAEPPEHASHVVEHVLLGMKGVNTVEHAITHGRPETLIGYGFAGMAEASLLHGRLGLELDFVFTKPGNELSMAGEPLVKLPFHLTRWLEPYVAAGPVLMRIHHGTEHRERTWLGGGQLVLGAFVWLADTAGLDVDLALGVAHGPDISLSELTIAIGPVLRN